MEDEVVSPHPSYSYLRPKKDDNGEPLTFTGVIKEPKSNDNMPSIKDAYERDRSPKISLVSSRHWEHR